MIFKTTKSTSKCEKIFSEKKSVTVEEGREQLVLCLDYVRNGDTLIVTKIDRLSRSLRDLQHLVNQLQVKGVDLKATEQPIDTSNAEGKAFLNMLGVFAEFETNLRKERQLEGIAKAKAEGKYKGRKQTARAKTAEVIKLTQLGHSRNNIAKELKIGIASVHRILKEYRESNALKLEQQRINDLECK